jgi:hypothetical protein
MEDMLASKSVHASYWDTNQQDDENVPSFSTITLSDPKTDQRTLGLSMMNHIDSPYIYTFEKNVLTDGYEILTMSEQPRINAPEGLDPTEALGCCLGFSLIQTKVAGVPDKIAVKLDEEDLEVPWPPVIVLYGLNGILRFYGVYVKAWCKASLLSVPKMIGPKQEEAKQGLMGA